jgi:TrmH family RNA methyltransferase
LIVRPPDPVERYRLARRDAGLVVVEGIHALKHAVRFGAEILDARTADAARLRRLVAELAPDVADAIRGLVRPTDRELFARLAPSPHPTGVIAIARRPALDVQAVLERSEPAPVVFLERPTHHGNIGAVVRVAAAAGAGAVLVTGDRDPWHPAAVRGGAGLQFALPVTRVESLPSTDRPIVALDPAGEPAAAGAIPRRSVLVFGSERTGISGALLHRAERRVAIPMAPGVSSLNLATAVAAVLYAYVPR